MRILFVSSYLTLAFLFSGFLGCSRQIIFSSDDPELLHIQYATEPVSLDPMLAEDGGALRILGNTMEGLMGYNEEGQLVPRLAQSFETSADGKKLTFTLRPNAKWSDGAPVSATDFVVALRRVLSPASRSKLGSMLLPIRGAAEFKEGKIPEEKLGVRDEGGKLIIDLEFVAPYFIQALSLPSALPIRADVLKAHEGDWPKLSPSTGPYQITEHIPDQKIILKKNPYYYGFTSELLAEVRDVELKFVADESTAQNLFDKGKLDILTKVHSIDLKRMRTKGVLRTDPFFAVYYIAFQTRKPPFDQKDWRRAVSGAIQREQILSALDTGDKPAASWIPHGIEGFMPYDHAKFVGRFQDAILKIQKHGRNHSKETIPAGFDNTHRNAMIMEKIQVDLYHVLKLKLSLQRLDWKSYIRMIQTDAPPIFRFGWQAPFMDPLPLLSVFTSDDPNNYTRWKNKEYDQLVKEISRMVPGPAREKKIRAAQEILVYKEAAVVPLYHYVQHHGVAHRVKGFRVNPFGVIRFDKLRLSP